jgi:hypothetical protein
VASSTWTTARGDSIYVEDTQEFVGDGMYVGPYTIVGGTGRFADVSGSGMLVSTVTYNSDGTATVTGYFDGTIGY